MERKVEKGHDPYKPNEPNEPIDFVDLDELIIVQDFGSVFAADSKPHLETGTFNLALAGDAPYMVDKWDGRLMSLAQPIQSRTTSTTI